MELWNVTYDAKKGVHKHSVPPGFGHALLVPLVTDVFQSLRVSASLRDDSGRFWRLHAGPSLSAYEVEHGKDRERYVYNDRCLAQARRSKKPVRVLIGTVAGDLHDIAR